MANPSTDTTTTFIVDNKENLVSIFDGLSSEAIAAIIANIPSENVVKKGRPRHSGFHCTNCKTTRRTSWRKGKNGERLCNACGLYVMKYDKTRPTKYSKKKFMSRPRKSKIVEVVKCEGKEKK